MRARRRPPNLPLAAILAVSTLAFSPRASAQDAHYWTYGYGPVGQLTEGTIVGGVSDLSAVFYNPGAIALIKEPRFTITLTSVELASLKAPNAAGPQLDFDSTIFDVVPAVIAGRLAHRDGMADQFAFAFLSRHDTNWDLGYSDANLSGSSTVATAGFGRVRERVLDYWLGPSWSHRVSDTVAIGVSPFFTYRAQRNRRSLTLEQLSSGAVDAVFVGKEYEYEQVGVLGKLGLAWRPGHLELGATVTTPRARIWSSGKTVFNATVAGVPGLPLLSASTQKGLKSTFHSPWSVAGGATWRAERTAVHTTVEWFSALDPYDILEPQAAEVAGSTTTIPLTYVGAAKSVVNFGAGVEHRLGDVTTLYGGVARNNSPWQPESETLASWNLTDVTAGISFERKGARVALGVGYGWGKDDIPRTITPPNDTGAAPVDVAAEYSRWTFSIGFSMLGSGK
jgi:hypothetical protein